MMAYLKQLGVDGDPATFQALVAGQLQQQGITSHKCFRCGSSDHVLADCSPLPLRILRTTLLHRAALHRSNHLTTTGRPLLLQPEPSPRQSCIVEDENMSGAPPVPNGCTIRLTNIMPRKHTLPIASLLVSLLSHHFQSPPPLPLSI